MATVNTKVVNTWPMYLLAALSLHSYFALFAFLTFLFITIYQCWDPFYFDTAPDPHPDPFREKTDPDPT